MPNERVMNGIECPECGKEMYDTSPDSTLLKSPPQKGIACEACGYSGFRDAEIVITPVDGVDTVEYK